MVSDDIQNKEKSFSLEELVKAKSTPKSILGIGEIETVSYLFKNPMIIAYLKQNNNPELLTSKQIKSLGKVFAHHKIINKEAETYQRDMNMIGHFCLPKIVKKDNLKVASFTLNKTALDAIDPNILKRFNDTAQNIALTKETAILSEQEVLKRRIPLPNVPVKKN